MSTQETIVITFADGGARVATEGFAGAACEAATADVERALGVVTENTRTADYTKPARTQRAQEARRG